MGGSPDYKSYGRAGCGQRDQGDDGDASSPCERSAVRGDRRIGPCALPFGLFDARELHRPLLLCRFLLSHALALSLAPLPLQFLTSVLGFLTAAAVLFRAFLLSGFALLDLICGASLFHLALLAFLLLAALGGFVLSLFFGKTLTGFLALPAFLLLALPLDGFALLLVPHQSFTFCALSLPTLLLHAAPFDVAAA